ncbi:hypothetical protein F5148DRAFT_1220600 [Russula earlei]|uniref:Uncharacterized protein n=1 Tax=Russula earlei TaxID=71964 RepID=A0ACC0U2P8_9AGAM|nr:hypothetical protein F5148DRAFT_1220600 [Russula earlei]
MMHIFNLALLFLAASIATPTLAVRSSAPGAPLTALGHRDHVLTSRSRNADKILSARGEGKFFKDTVLLTRDVYPRQLRGPILKPPWQQSSRFLRDKEFVKEFERLGPPRYALRRRPGSGKQAPPPYSEKEAPPPYSPPHRPLPQIPSTKWNSAPRPERPQFAKRPLPVPPQMYG